MTYSLIAMDSERNYIVVAAATKTEAVGANVPALAPGFGAVLSQAFTNPELRQLVLAGLQAGLEPAVALQDALAADPEPQLRQLAVMDRDGRVAVHTGSGCTPSYGQYAVENFVCIGNLLKNDGVVPAMARAWRNPGSLEELVQNSFDCLLAAENAGGDSRGRQSAAVMIAQMKPEATLIQEIRVDDSTDPLAELRQQLDLWLLARAPSV